MLIDADSSEGGELYCRSVAVAYKLSVGKLLRKHMLCPLISTAQAVYNQEIRGQERSEGQSGIVAAVSHCIFRNGFSFEQKK